MRVLKTMTALLATGFLGMAAAAAVAGVPAVAVEYTQADLASPAKIARLHSRLVFAAKQVCERYAGDELARQRAFKLCTTDSLAAGVARIQNPALSAYHLRKTGQPRGAAVAVAALTVAD